MLLISTGNRFGDFSAFTIPAGFVFQNRLLLFPQTDTMPSLEKEHEYRDEHFDFIQQWVRRFCLRYGAALVYTSAKEANNCDLLFKYISHRVYGVPHKFVTPGLVVEKESVFM